jgi:hypothetical protein
MSSEKKMVLELHKNEVALILAIRKRFRHGEVIVIVRDGIPQYIKRAWESLDFVHPEQVDDLTPLKDSSLL